MNIFYLSIFRLNIYGLFNFQILDREEYENYIIHLIANDTNNQSELFIYLILLDINDNIPIFNQTYIHIKINRKIKFLLVYMHMILIKVIMVLFNMNFSEKQIKYFL